MKIVELFLDDNEESGIEAISIVESPAIESDFIALKSDEIKLAEVDKEKKILMGALLIPNKPIYRKTEGDEYYIYFSRETVLKASQRYLMNGYQGNSTLEHSDNLQGLTLVESWIVEDEVQDKSRKYDMNVPIGTWMGTVKVNNEEVWNNYVKTGKVKGFSIEGFFADKIKASKMNKEQEADLLLSKITSILKGERVDLAGVDDLSKFLTNLKKASEQISSNRSKLGKNLRDIESLISDLKVNYNTALKNKQAVDVGINSAIKISDQIAKQAKELGVKPSSVKGVSELISLVTEVEDSQEVVDSFINMAKKYIK
jgi:flagellin-like hook-associated protein FlgL